MSIWIPRLILNPKFEDILFKECIVIEELDDYKKSQGYMPKIVNMFSKDSSGNYLIIPSAVAKKYGFQNINPFHRKISYIKNGERYPKFTGVLRDYQLDVIPKIRRNLQIFESVIIGLPPGAGKTIITNSFIVELEYLTCVICKQIKVKDGWIKTFEKTSPGLRIWIVGENNPSEYDVILCMNERIDKIPESVKIQVGTLIVDEVHTISTPSQKMTFLGFSPKYIIFLSATFKASNFYKMSELCSGNHGVYIRSKTPHYVFAIRTGCRGSAELNKKGGIIPSSISKSLLANKLRLNIILNLIYNHIGFRKIIVMQRLTEGIDGLQEGVTNLGITCDTLYGTKKNYYQSQVLIGTFQKIGTGFDEENACMNYEDNPTKSDTVILATSIMSIYLYYQVVGRVMMRVLDEIPAVFYLIDENSNVKRHFDGMRKEIKDTNGIIVDLDYRNIFLKPTKLKFQPSFTQGNFYKVLNLTEYKEFYNYGIFIGSKEEQDGKYITLQSEESVQYYRNKLCNNTTAFILEVTYCNLYCNNGFPYYENGLLYCKHSIFQKNVLNVIKV